MIAARVLEAVAAERDAVAVDRDREALERAGWRFTQTDSGWAATNTRLRHGTSRGTSLVGLLSRIMQGEVHV